MLTHDGGYPIPVMHGIQYDIQVRYKTRTMRDSYSNPVYIHA